MEMTQTSNSDNVVVTDGSDKYHRAHPSALLHLACQPTVKGEAVRLKDVGDRDACNHLACFGEAGAEGGN
jgi:hypothetical protein